MGFFNFNLNTVSFKQIRKAVAVVVLTAFIATSLKTQAMADFITFSSLPKPGVMVKLSPDFTPAHLKGIVIHPENPLKFDFLISRGDEILNDQEKHDTYQKLIKYFLASLAIPEDNQWVNLSPSDWVERI